eukprot:gnl/MRDRNA2_/MRDRNA2_23707_c0_seq1.p1 gnl/MRDRNA2_/MRDRNA2_23707_c0~~gnl/MRDRNA2_/MRDRNA2_23707_c0_seq1.p1  ORF type:complete len:135 (-),score=29.49 gnl/MRDRNA2_/MRDRNA2_23707_c0_seq1:603-1007(-)
MLGSLGFAAAAELPAGGITLAHVAELVLIVTVTTNFMQFCWSSCAFRPKGHLGHLTRFAPFYAALLATPLLCFPKAAVVVGDLMPSAESKWLASDDGPKQWSAIAGAVAMVAAAILLSLAPTQDKKVDPLLPSS